MACPHDLLARARSNALSPLEQEQLALHLRQCSSCRIARQLAADFDQVTTVFAGDEQRILRITNRLVRHRHRRRRRTWVVPLIAAAIVGLGAAAAARWGAGRGHTPIAAVVSADTAREPASSKKPNRGRPVATPLGRERTASEGERERTASEGERERTASEGERELQAADVREAKRNSEPRDRGRDSRALALPIRERPEVTPRAVFSEANRLRAAGRIPEAIVSYRNLQEQFPRSPEAMLSRVSLGNLLMVRDEAESALGQFKAYLSANPRGPLAEEALFGEARALGALGRADEERAVWDVLGSAYPGSIYAAARSKAPVPR